MIIQIILLAAGRGLRFYGEACEANADETAAGGAGKNKLLYPIDGRPLYRHLFDRLLQLRARLDADGTAGKLVVVTAYREIADYVEKQGAVCVKNGRQDWGISYSVRLGIGACSPESAGCEGGGRETAGGEDCAYLFCVADQPWFSLEDLEGLIRGWLASGKGIGVPVQKGRLGNPCIFDRNYLPQLLSLSGDLGGKSIAKKYPEEVYLYEIEGEKGLEDIDYCPGDEKREPGERLDDR